MSPDVDPTRQARAATNTDVSFLLSHSERIRDTAYIILRRWSSEISQLSRQYTQPANHSYDNEGRNVNLLLSRYLVSAP